MWGVTGEVSGWLGLHPAKNMEFNLKACWGCEGFNPGETCLYLHWMDEQEVRAEVGDASWRHLHGPMSVDKEHVNKNQTLIKNLSI